MSVPPPLALRGKTIEEIVNKWSSELEVHVREFNKFAGEVAVWDRALMENGNNVWFLSSRQINPLIACDDLACCSLYPRPGSGAGTK